MFTPTRLCVVSHWQITFSSVLICVHVWVRMCIFIATFSKTIYKKKRKSWTLTVTVTSEMQTGVLWSPLHARCNIFGNRCSKLHAAKLNKASWKMVNMFWITSMCVLWCLRLRFPHMSRSHSSLSEHFHREKREAQSGATTWKKKLFNKTKPKQKRSTKGICAHPAVLVEGTLIQTDAQENSLLF